MTASAPRVTRIDTDAPWTSDVVAVPVPVLSWTIETDAIGWRQAEAAIRWESEGRAEEARILGAESVRVPWPFAALRPRQQGIVRVQVVGDDGETSEWSAPRTIVAGFLAPGEWDATWIGLPDPVAHGEPGYLRREFVLDRVPMRAVLYATAIGVYQVALNGTDVDDQVLKPGWTAYQHRTVHETTDVTALLRPGANAIGVRLAGAWGTELFGFRGNARARYGDQPRFAARLHLSFADGSERWIATNHAWAAARGPLRASGLYAGETYDARRMLRDAHGRGFAEPGYDAAGWRGAAPAEAGPEPEARVSPFVRRVEEVRAVATLTTPSGATVVDFGQNLVGRVRLRVRGPAGTTVTLRHAEVLEDGELCVRPLRRAAATDRYTLAGGEEETWEPEFTFHGFRYVEVTGWPGAFSADRLTAVVVHSDMERTGWFETTHPLLQRFHDNVVWSMRGNVVSLPTDCPQRDERLGWTGDIQVFAPTAAFLYDVRGFLDSWLRDLALEQGEDGLVPFVVPDAFGMARPAAAWGDAATAVPDALYEAYADRGILRRQYDSARRWTDLILGLAGPRRIWEGGFQFGDWLDPAAPPHRPGEALTAPGLVATAYLARSTALVARAAAELGLADDAEHYARIAAEAVHAFRAEYVTPAGRLVSDTPTASALALSFGLVDDDRRAAVAHRLAALVRENGYRIATGFVGTPLVLGALCEAGMTDAAARLLLQTACPSWLYPVTMGATTVWERWDSMLPDGSVNPGDMTSFNHYALGAVADTLHRTVAGLAPAAPGYRRLRIAPHPLPGLDDALARHRTPYGLAEAGWRRSPQGIRVTARVPVGVDADVRLPDGRELVVGAGTHAWEVPLATVPAPGAVGLGSSLAEVVDDADALAIVAEVLDRHAPGAWAEALAATRWSAGRELAEVAFQYASPTAQRELAERLAALTAARRADA